MNQIQRLSLLLVLAFFAVTWMHALDHGWLGGALMTVATLAVGGALAALGMWWVGKGKP